MSRHLFMSGIVAVCVTILGGSAHAQTAAAGSDAAQPAPAAAAAPPAAPAPPPTPVPFEQALSKAANALFSKVPPPQGSEKLTVVIDPLIDGVTGAQTAGSQRVEKMIIELVQREYPHLEIKPFTSDMLAGSPILLIGTFTAINNSGDAAGPRDAYRICLRLADVASKKIIANSVSRAEPAGIDPTPTASFVDSPVWAKEAPVEGYIKSCQTTKAGDPLDQAYADQMEAGTFIAEGHRAYDEGRYEDALAAYEAATKLPGGDQLRVRQGIYNANVKLNRATEAAEAFGNIVDHGLQQERLAVKFLFRVGTTDLFGNRPYAMWVDQIAKRAAAKDMCLELVGHASRTGAEAFNDTLSAERAVRIRDLMEQGVGEQAPALKTVGVGWRENLVGIGTDDEADALDRRVEFRVSATC